jgi:hypothetical protein
MEGLHSPWGLLGKIMDARGYTLKQVLWGESWINLMMEYSDSPRYVKGTRAATFDNVDDLKKALGR